MNLIELSYYLQNEQAAREYLQQQGILKIFTICPYCNSEKIGNIRRDRMKCYKCKKEWHKRKESFLESRHISYAKFIGLLKLFSDEQGVSKISDEIDIDIKTVIEIFEEIRLHLFPIYHIFSCANSSGSRYLYKDKQNKICFTDKPNILQSNNNCYCRLITIRKKTLENSYSFDVDLEWVNGNDKSTIYHINRFLSYIKLKLALFRGLSYKNFDSFFYELLIRYNNIGENFMDLVLNCISVKGG